jgi:hypothetical protein
VKPLVLTFFVLALWPAKACVCENTGGGACRQVSAETVAFIGRVVSVTPRFLDHWNLSRRPALNEILQMDEKALEDASAGSLAALKARIREKIPDMTPALAGSLEAATNRADVLRVFERLLNEGRHVRLEVNTMFANGDEDDSADDDDDAASLRFVDLTTPFGDCGFDFQVGEAYLVFAVKDEDAKEIATGACSATKRLSDAGADLPYLFYYRDNHKAAHIEGITTFDERLRYEPPPDNGFVNLPAPGVVVGLSSKDGTRYAASNEEGRFVFDGIEPGSYTLNAWAHGYPDSVTLLAGPDEFEVGVRACTTRVLTIPKP